MGFHFCLPFGYNWSVDLRAIRPAHWGDARAKSGRPVGRGPCFFPKASSERSLSQSVHDMPFYLQSAPNQSIPARSRKSTDARRASWVLCALCALFLSSMAAGKPAGAQDMGTPTPLPPFPLLTVVASPTAAVVPDTPRPPDPPATNTAVPTRPVSPTSLPSTSAAALTNTPVPTHPRARRCRRLPERSYRDHHRSPDTYCRAHPTGPGRSLSSRT